MEPLEEGITFIETLWYSLACNVVEKAIEVYKVNEEQATELRNIFLKRGEYSVQVK